MNIAELFVNLGVKGSDKTVGAITGMRQGLKDTASTSLETKAAIVGAMYALERLFATSGRTGTGLTNFTSLVGVSAQTLQRYQYAARQVGISNEEMEGTFKGLQDAMTKTLTGKGAPEGLARVAAVIGRDQQLLVQDIAKWQKDPDKLLQVLQEYAGKETNQGFRNQVLKSFGVGDNMIAGLNRRAFTPQQLAKAPTYSDNEIASLDKANIAWSNLGTKIEMAVGHFNAQHGGQLVKDISGITDKVLGLVGAFQKLSEKADFFKWLGKVFEGWQHIFDGLTKAIDFINNAKQKDVNEVMADVGQMVGSVLPPQAQKVVDEYEPEWDTGPKKPRPPVPPKGPEPTDWRMKMITAVAEMAGAVQRIVQEQSATAGIPGGLPKERSVTPGVINLPPPVPQNAAVPRAPAVPQAATGGSAPNVNVTQTLNFNHDGKDARVTGDSVKQAVRSSFRSMPSQAQGN